MSPYSAGLLLLVTVAGLAVAHPSPSSLRDRWSGSGLLATALGAGLLVLAALETEFVVLAAAGTQNCARLLGLSGDISELRARIAVERVSFPPRVVCSAGGEVRTLTEAGQTTTWAVVEVVGWCVAALGVALLAAGLWRVRRAAHAAHAAHGS